MADELSYDWETGYTLYAVRWTKGGQVFLSDGSASETWGDSGHDADDYDVAMTEDVPSGHYIGSFDASGNITDEAAYDIAIFIQVGVNPADSDVPGIARGEILWDGEQEITLLITNDTSPTVVEDEVPTVEIDPDSGDSPPGGGAGSPPGGGAEGGGGSVVSGGPSGCG